MTDKEEVIIDGVDVSGCRYYKESLNLEYMRIDSCKGYGFCIHKLPSREFVISPRYNIPRCHRQKFCNYKQLQSKEQECEELKKENLAYKQTCEDLKNALDESMQECLDLAKVIEEYSQKQRQA